MVLWAGHGVRGCCIRAKVAYFYFIIFFICNLTENNQEILNMSPDNWPVLIISLPHCSYACKWVTSGTDRGTRSLHDGASCCWITTFLQTSRRSRLSPTDQGIQSAAPNAVLCHWILSRLHLSHIFPNMLDHLLSVFTEPLSPPLLRVSLSKTGEFSRSENSSVLQARYQILCLSSCGKDRL